MVGLTVTPDDIDNTREKHLQKIMRAIDGRIAYLLSQKSSCCHQCDATYLGLLLKKLATDHISLRLPCFQSTYLPFTSMPLEGKSLSKVISSVTKDKPKSEVCNYSRYDCLNRANPWGTTVESCISNLQQELQVRKTPTIQSTQSLFGAMTPTSNSFSVSSPFVSR